MWRMLGRTTLTSRQRQAGWLAAALLLAANWAYIILVVG